ncbi:MAG: phosphatidate cytidylyltransferase [Christensenellales bacterium]
MMTRTLTGAGLFLLLFFALWMGGWVFAILWIACVLIAIGEEFRVLSAAGHRPVTWPTWAALLISIPSFLLLDETKSTGILIAMVFFTFLVVCTNVLFRSNPLLEDMLFSILPLMSVALPGMSLLALNGVTPSTQKVLLALAFLVPVIGDTSAYFVGVRYGRVKLNPIVSPKKTVEGAIGGLLGSLVTALAVYLLAQALGVRLPGIWHFAVIGLLGGLVGQIGDLFASIVKRHCQVKDFGTIFPGHGGMMDRLDSILFVAVFIYAYHQLIMF